MDEEQKVNKQEYTVDHWSTTFLTLAGNDFTVLFCFFKGIMKPYEVPQLVNCDSKKAEQKCLLCNVSNV